MAGCPRHPQVELGATVQTTSLEAQEALKEIFDEIVSVIPDDVGEVIEELEKRGFVIVRKSSK